MESRSKDPHLQGKMVEKGIEQSDDDAVGPLGVNLAKSNARIRAMGASINWWISDPKNIKQLDLKLKLVTELRAYQAHRVDKLTIAFRAILRVMDLFPSWIE